MYRVVVADKDGEELGEFTHFLGLDFGKRLNNFGKATVDLSVIDPTIAALISLRRYEIKIYRDDVLVWAGEQVHHNGTLDDTNEFPLKLDCFTYLEGFNGRFTDKVRSFTDVDYGEIIDTLIQESQALDNGWLGVVTGTIETTSLHTDTYYRANILQTAINLSQREDGFDFDISDLKIFDVWEHRGTDKSADVIFEYGVNMEAPTIDTDFTNPVNQSIYQGSGFGEDRLESIQEDVYSQPNVRLRQALTLDADVSVQGTLDSKSLAIVNRFKTPLITITFRVANNTFPDFTDLDIGDSVRIKIKKGIYDINNVFRIYGYNVQVDGNGKETIEYFVSLIQ